MPTEQDSDVKNNVCANGNKVMDKVEQMERQRTTKMYVRSCVCVTVKNHRAPGAG